MHRLWARRKQCRIRFELGPPMALCILTCLVILAGPPTAHGSKPAYPICPRQRTTLGDATGNVYKNWRKQGYNFQVEYGAQLWWNTGKYMVGGKYVKGNKCLDNRARCSHVVALSWRAYKEKRDKADGRSPILCAQAGLAGGTSPGNRLVEVKVPTHSSSKNIRYKGKDVVCDRLDTSKKGRHRFYRAWIALPPGSTSPQKLNLGVNFWVNDGSGRNVRRLAKISVRANKVTPCYPRRSKPKRSGPTDDELAQLLVYGGGGLLLLAGLGYGAAKVLKHRKSKQRSSKPGSKKPPKQKTPRRKTARKRPSKKRPQASPKARPDPGASQPQGPATPSGQGVGSIEFEGAIPPALGQGPSNIEFEDEPHSDDDRQEEEQGPKTLILSSDLSSIASNGSDQATITARVLDFSGTPSSGVEVSFSASKGGDLASHGGVTGQDGSLQTSWQPPRNAEGFFIVEARCSQAQPPTQTVHLEAEREPPARMELTIQPGELPPDGWSRATVTALVFGQSGQPVEGARVGFFTDQDKSRRDIRREHVRSDEAGMAQTEFQMPRHPQGEAVRVFGRIERFQGRALEPPVEAETLVKVAQTIVAGLVKDQHGNAIAGAKVDLMKAGTNMSLMEHSGPDGGFSYHDPKPMAYEVRAFKKGYEQDSESSAEFELEPGETKQIQLVLRRTLGLSLSIDRQRLPADGKAEARLQAELLDGGGQPVPDEGLEITVEGEDPGQLEPASATTDNDGQAVFTYRASESEGEYQITCQAANSTETQASVNIEQHQEPYWDVQLKHHPFEPILRLYKRPEAAGKFSRLSQSDLSRVEVLSHDRQGPFQGSLGEMNQGWTLAALIAFLDCSPNASFYMEQAERLRDQAEDFKLLAGLIEDLLGRHDYLRAFAEGLSHFKLYYEVITLPLSGAKGIADWLANSSLVSTFLGWGESLAGADQSAIKSEAKDKWRQACQDEARLARKLADKAEALGHIWETIEWDQGREDLVERLLPRGTVAGDQNESGAYWAALMELFDLQIIKAQLAAASLGRDQDVSAQVLSARQDLRELKVKWGEALQAAGEIQALANALPGMQEGTD